MQREQFESLLKRAAQLLSRDEWIVFGSQAAHAATSSPPAEVLISVECDIWLPDDPETTARLVTTLGKDSQFARENGVYVDALPPHLPLVPEGWEQRLTSLKLETVTARCLEIHDLVVTKLAAGRLKDYEFIAAALLTNLARREEIERRIQTFREPHTQAVLLARLRIAAESSDVL
jgi:hypothetical protein